MRVTESHCCTEGINSVNQLNFNFLKKCLLLIERKKEKKWEEGRITLSHTFPGCTTHYGHKFSINDYIMHQPGLD